MNKPIYHLFLTLMVFVLLSGCKGNEASPDDFKNPGLSIPDRVESLLSQMTIREKVGQMTQVERSQIQITTIKDNVLGSVLNGGGSSPGNSPVDWADMYDQFQEQALATRLGIPIIYGTDAVHGHNNVKGATIFPHNIGLGCTRNPELIQEINEITATEVAATGIDWTFAPAIPVVRDERWGRTYESFGETPELAELLGEAAILGLQFSNGQKIAACAKHFIGDGGTNGGHDQGNTIVSEVDLREIHLPGYKAAVDQGVYTVMASYSSWNGTKVHGSEYLLTTVLKDELGFDGFVISDWAAVDQLPGSYSDQVKKAINAGVDMVMVPYDYQKFITTLLELIEDGDITIERIDDAVSRILTVKFKLGLFEEPFTDRDLLSEIENDSHRDVARRAVRESLVLLKNENAVLPISKTESKVFVSGKNADNLGHQMGGWSIYWQGGSGDITEGTTILDGIRETSGNQVGFNLNGTGASDSDVAIAVIGETPYAEGAGDKSDLSLSGNDIDLVRSLKSQGLPVVVILISGRPLILDPILEDADAIIAAWLPGSEGIGIADVLFGDYNPTGKLSITWPRSNAQLPINFGDADYDPLFEYGFGLSY